MKPDENRQYLFDNPNNVRLVVRGLIAGCVILAGLDLVLHRHAAHPWEALITFYPLYGFVACVLLVLLAKEMRKLVMRDEDYYEDSPAVDNVNVHPPNSNEGSPPPPGEGQGGGAGTGGMHVDASLPAEAPPPGPLPAEEGDKPSRNDQGNDHV